MIIVGRMARGPQRRRKSKRGGKTSMMEENRGSEGIEVRERRDVRKEDRRK